MENSKCTSDCSGKPHTPKCRKAKYALKIKSQFSSKSQSNSIVEELYIFNGAKTEYDYLKEYIIKNEITENLTLYNTYFIKKCRDGFERRFNEATCAERLNNYKYFL